MTSKRKIKVNRINARASTGPKTELGKARSALNAYRHGLSSSVISNPLLAEQVAKLAREFVGESGTPELGELARHVAEAQIDIIRIRWARHHLLERETGIANYDELTKQILRIDRYERRALSRRKFAIRALDAERGQAAASAERQRKIG